MIVKVHLHVVFCQTRIRNITAYKCTLMQCTVQLFSFVLNKELVMIISNQSMGGLVLIDIQTNLSIILGPIARDFFLKSELATDVLSKIW